MTEFLSMMKIKEMIDIVGTKDLQEIGKVWNYFDCSVYLPSHPEPYKELGVLVCRGRIIKKAHNCLIYQSLLGSSDFEYFFRRYNTNTALSIHYRDHELSFILYYAYNTEGGLIEYFYVTYSKEQGKLVLVEASK
jgi:hypothetical protein